VDVDVYMHCNGYIYVCVDVYAMCESVDGSVYVL